MSETITITVKSKLQQSHIRGGIAFAPGITRDVEVTEDQHQAIAADPHLRIVDDAQPEAEAPSIPTKKAELQDFLRERGVEFADDLKVAELRDLATQAVADGAAS